MRRYRTVGVSPETHPFRHPGPTYRSRKVSIVTPTYLRVVQTAAEPDGNINRLVHVAALHPIAVESNELPSCEDLERATLSAVPGFSVGKFPSVANALVTSKTISDIGKLSTPSTCLPSQRSTAMM